MSGWDVFRVAVADACWLGFVLVWVVGWLINLRRAPRVRRRGRVACPTLVILVLLVVLARLVPPGVFRPLVYRATWLEALGVALLVVSTAFTIWARVRLGTMWTAQPVLKQQHQLRTDGPYAITRHPIYTGLLGMVVGTTLVNGFGHWLVVLVVAVVLLELKIRAEETLLSEEFGEQYAEFRRRVPRLVPGPRSRRVPR